MARRAGALGLPALLLVFGLALSIFAQETATPWDVPVEYWPQDSPLALVSAHCGRGPFMMGNGYELMGELRNSGTTCITGIQLVASMVSADGTAMGSGDGATMLDVLQPGEAAPFCFGIYSAYGPVRACQLRASWLEATQTPSRAVEFGEVQLEGPYQSMYTVAGYVVNRDNVAAHDVCIVFTCYDAAGRVVDVGCVDAICHNFGDLRCSDCADGLSEIASGGRALFRCAFLRNPKSIVSVRGVIQYTRGVL